MKLISLFSGCGGLDLGFKKAGFKIIWANEFDKTIVPTFKKNFSRTYLDTRSILDIKHEEVPDCEGIIGGPPCQSWSAFGKGKGFSDPRGKLFEEYIRFVQEKKPKFFLAENVQGITFLKHSKAMQRILDCFKELGYNVSLDLLNTNNYGVPQTRKRIIIVGYPASFGEFFYPPKEKPYKPVLKDVIFHLRNNSIPAKPKNYPNPKVKVPNHEYMIGSFSYHYMSRNRVQCWNKPSFTIQASGRHAPCHPDSSEMIKVKKDVRKFKNHKKVRRLSIKECALIQTFPDDFKFEYSQVNEGYKMIGNAVPVEFARQLAFKIKKDLKKYDNLPVKFRLKGKLRTNRLIK